MNEFTREADVEYAIGHALAHQAIGDAELMHEVDRAMLQHAGADAAFDVIAASRLEHDAFDVFARQQERQEQSCRSGSDDPNLCPHALPTMNRRISRMA